MIMLTLSRTFVLYYELEIGAGMDEHGDVGSGMGSREAQADP